MPHISQSQDVSVIVGNIILSEREMQSKTENIKTTLARGDWLDALRLASRFHDRSNDTLTFKRGFDAYQHPNFYRQLGKDPDELINAAIKRLRRLDSADEFKRALQVDSETQEVVEKISAHRKRVLGQAVCWGVTSLIIGRILHGVIFAMKTFLLLVTWLAHNQPPSTTQVTFTSVEACETARLQVIKDAERMRQEKLERLVRESQRSGVSLADVRLSATLSAPSVSAVCVAQ